MRKNETVSRIVPVRPDGKISLPLLNDVQAAGLTPLELRDVLTQKLADYMPTPEVSVIVTEKSSTLSEGRVLLVDADLRGASLRGRLGRLRTRH